MDIQSMLVVALEVKYGILAWFVQFRERTFEILDDGPHEALDGWGSVPVEPNDDGS